MANNFNQRLRDFIHYLNISDLEFSKSIGHKSPEKISRLTRNDSNNPSFQILLDISNKYEKIIHIEWLLTGRGQMLRSKTTTKNTVSEPEIEYHTPHNQLERENEMLKKFNDEMLLTQKHLRDYIELLKQK